MGRNKCIWRHKGISFKKIQHLLARDLKIPLLHPPYELSSVKTLISVLYLKFIVTFSPLPLKYTLIHCYSVGKDLTQPLEVEVLTDKQDHTQLHPLKHPAVTGIQ